MFAVDNAVYPLLHPRDMICVLFTRKTESFLGTQNNKQGEQEEWGGQVEVR